MVKRTTSPLEREGERVIVFVHVCVRERVCGGVQLCRDRAVEFYCHYALLRTDRYFLEEAQQSGAGFWIYR